MYSLILASDSGGGISGGLGINLYAFLSQIITFVDTDLEKRAEQILAEARRQSQETIERAARVAEQEASRIREEARVQAEQISQQQIARFQQEANRARIELSRIVVNLSIDAAGKVINRSVDNNDNRRMVEEFVTASKQTRER